MQIQKISVSAAGRNERIRPELVRRGFPADLPKYMLPAGAGAETLLSRICDQICQAGATPYAYVLPELTESVTHHLGESAVVGPKRAVFGPMGNLYLDVISARDGEVVAMCAADFWAEVDWARFIRFHLEHGRSASIVVARSAPTLDGAVFTLGDDGAVESWQRGTSGKEDLINVGLYVVTATPAVKAVLRELHERRDDMEAGFNDAFTSRGELYAYTLTSPAFNVNRMETYDALLCHLGEAER